MRLLTLGRLLIVGIAAVIAETGIVGVPGSVFSQVHFLVEHNGEWGFRFLAVVLAAILVLLAVGPQRASAWMHHLRGSGPPAPQAKSALKPLPGTPSATDPVWEGLAKVMHAGGKLLDEYYRDQSLKGWLDRANRWAWEGRDEIEALTDATEGALFAQAGSDQPGPGSFSKELAAKVEYIRDNLQPKARAGYWDFNATAVERRKRELAHERTKIELAEVREREQAQEQRKQAAAKATKPSWAPPPLTQESPLAAAVKKSQREERDPAVARLTKLANRVQDLVDARRVEEPRDARDLAEQIADPGAHERDLTAHRKKTMALYYERLRTDAVAAFDEALRLKGANVEDRQIIAKPMGTAALALVPDILRRSADRLRC